MNCPKCNQPMENLGNVSGIVMTSMPEQWDETHVCHACKVKMNVRCEATLPPSTRYLDDYERIKPAPGGKG